MSNFYNKVTDARDSHTKATQLNVILNSSTAQFSFLENSYDVQSPTQKPPNPSWDQQGQSMVHSISCVRPNGSHYPQTHAAKPFLISSYFSQARSPADLILIHQNRSVIN